MDTRAQLDREAGARKEVGHTDVRPAVARFLVAMFLGTVVAVPAIQTVVERSGGDRGWPANLAVGRILPSVDSISELLESDNPAETFSRFYAINAGVLRGIAEFETDLEESSAVFRAVRPAVQYALVGHMKAGNEQVYPGVDNWLFYRPGVDYLTGRGFLDPRVLEKRRLSGSEWEAPPQPDPVRAIVEFRDQLATRDIVLVLVPAPAKAMIYPERLTSRYDAETPLLQNPSYAEFVAAMETSGIRIFDPTPLLDDMRRDEEEPVFLRSDTHWSPRATARVASALADYLQRQGLVGGPEVEYATREVAVANLGDIARMLQLPEDQSFYPEQEVAVEQVMNAEGGLWRPDRDAEVLVLGDSYANIFSLAGMGWGESAGFVEHLSAALGKPVDAIRVNDNGAHATREQLSRELRRGNDRLAGKRVVVYEFAIRELAVGDWKTGFDMRVGVRTSRTGPDAAVIVEGTIADITRPPEPGSVPYADCIVAARLVDLEVVDGILGADQIVVFQWGMRDNSWTHAARYREGRRVRFRLVPWRAVEADYGSYTRIELDDDESLFLDTFWALLETVERGPGGAVRTSNRPEGSATDSPQISSGDDSNGTLAAQFRRKLEEIYEALDDRGENVYRGEDGWLFFAPELRHLSVGRFWGDDAIRVSRATNPEYADPLPAILDFHRQLAGDGISLILVPVPPKAIVYPDSAVDAVEVEEGTAPPRLDTYHQEFYDVLRGEGVQVLDLTDDFLRRRANGEKLYCEQDTHWSPHACEIAAAAIAEALAEVQLPSETAYEVRGSSVTITGDLWRSLNEPALPREQLTIRAVGQATGDTFRLVEPQRDSPVVLLADSHGLVFHAGQDMHATGAGLADHLARELGSPVDLVAVRGSGATPARMSLLRRGDNLEGKKAVVWCFTAREFTEATGGWRPLPVIR